MINIVTLHELEKLKNSARINNSLKPKVRSVIRLLEQNDDKFEVDFGGLEELRARDLDSSPDYIICAGAYLYNKHTPITLISEDISLRLIATKLFQLNVDNLCKIDKNLYSGFRRFEVSNEQLAALYEYPARNQFELLINEYGLLKTSDDTAVAIKWDGEKCVTVYPRTFKSRFMDVIKPLDLVQECAMDSIATNDITFLHGTAGSGKTTLPLAYLLQAVDEQRFRKLNIIYHYEPLRNARTLGYEKGTHTEKLLNSGAISRILGSKVKDLQYILSLLSHEIEIIPTANIRGVEFGDDEAVFVTECQNIDIYTMKTILQRCKSGCKQIYEGDLCEQTDVNLETCGMSRAIEVLAGHSSVGCIKLDNNYRSEIHNLTEQM